MFLPFCAGSGAGDVPVAVFSAISRLSSQWLWTDPALVSESIAQLMRLLSVFAAVTISFQLYGVIIDKALHI